MKREQLRGTGVALVTPFKKDGSLDLEAYKRLIDYVIEGGVEYIVVLGTTGESPVISSEEKKQLIKTAIKTAGGKVRVVVGYGGNNTQRVVEDILQSDFEGVDAILSVSPYYNKPTQEGIYQHYMRIADAAPVPVIIYNVPGRTGSNITAQTTLKLARQSDKFIAVKEASGNFTQCMHIVKERPDRFLVLSGDDITTLPMIAFGMEGVISVVANAFPREFSQMVRDCLKGNWERARATHYKLLDIMELLFVEGNPGGIKAALEILGICENNLRLPLAPVSPSTYNALKEAIRQLG